ncbi:MAG: 23S rRNA (uracil(1939)-C(5))-methyltransferase RlmD [Rubricoccaceae bacterium]|nr:23S rRNA (uracil(1939)-C(5))-methyltransferase RlmD [Rubricoccaceae bacterium]
METPLPPPPRPATLKRGAEIELTLDKFADRGKSLARLAAEGGAAEGGAAEGGAAEGGAAEGRSGYVVFVAGAVPGDRVRARVFKRKTSFAEARLLEVLEPSPLRTEPRCEYFAHCGGCKWQHVQYEAQREMKRDAVADALGVPVRPTLGADPHDGSGGLYFYRNKMEFSFSAHRWLTDWEIASGETMDKDFALGLHVPGRFDKVLDLQACYLQSAWSVRLVNGVRAFAKARGWTPWDTKRQRGFLRHLVIRQPAHTDERMVVLVTSHEDAERMAAFSDWLRTDFPEVTTLVNTINSGVAQTAYGETMTTVFGPGVVHDRLGRYTFEIAPNAFFQTNTRQAERLYDVALEVAELQPGDLVYDLYCGAGTIALYLSKHVRRVVGVELIEEAVANARANAVANGVDNCTFVAGDMLKLFTPDFVEAHGRPDVVVVDPPRAGMHPKVVAQIGRLRPERLVYVSCNPQTQARDLALLGDRYRITAVQPVDLFPHTHHVENVVALRAA